MIGGSFSHHSHARKVAAAAILSLAYTDRAQDDLLTWYMGILFGTLYQVQRRNRRIWYRTGRNETKVRRRQVADKIKKQDLSTAARLSIAPMMDGTGSSKTVTFFQWFADVRSVML